MHIPGLLERVRLLGVDEVYLVTRVDHEARMADMLPLVYGSAEIHNVPFNAIQAVPGWEPPNLWPN
jgi:hypothetical protein